MDPDFARLVGQIEIVARHEVFAQVEYFRKGDVVAASDVPATLPARGWVSPFEDCSFIVFDLHYPVDLTWIEVSIRPFLLRSCVEILARLI